MNIRLLLFKLFDKISGNVVSNNVDEIKFINEVEDQKVVEQFQNKRISDLLKHATNNIAFYHNVDHSTLDNFPVINKTKLKASIDEFISPLRKRNKLYKMITSGSTGTPFICYQDARKKKRNTSDALYFGNIAGFQLGEPLFYLKIWSEMNKKTKFIKLLQNVYTIDVLHFAGGNEQEVLDKINKLKSNIHINSYASSLEEMCKFLESKNGNAYIHKKVNIKSIIAQSESLSDDTKQKIEKYFKCVPCSRYSNIENGIIAQQSLKNNNVFKINQASYYVEILKMNNNKRAEAGELGRIVVTDLFNYAMPFIRYDTGDVGRFATQKDGTINRSILVEIQGRKLDLLLDTKGNVISSFIMYKNMFKYPEIDQYQMVQENKRHYRFIISMKGEFKKENFLREEFLSYLGSDAQFNVEYVNEIPLLDSGKRRKIINNYMK